MSRSATGRDLSSGSIPRHLLALSMPMLAGNLIHSGYTIINTVWVGKMVGPDAVAAIAVSFPVVFLFIAVSSGATLATTILVAQRYGARDYESLKKVVGCSFAISALLALLFTAVCLLSADLILGLLNTPASVAGLASSYLRISACGFVFMFLSLLITSILRGIGDTVTPLIFMGSGVLLNAVLDPFLIIGVGPLPCLGLRGAALASVISGAFSLFLGLLYLVRNDSVAAFRPGKLSLDAAMTGLIFRIGLPSMLQQSLVALGLGTVMSFVNSFGAAATAAFGAATRIDHVAFLPAMSIGMAVSVLTGQNMGAGRLDRVRETFLWGIVMTTAITGSAAIVFVSVPGLLLRAFVDDAGVIAIGTGYLRIVGPAVVLFAVMYVSNGVINGAGRTMVTLFFTVLAMWIVRIPLAAHLHRTELGITGIWIAFTTGFAVAMVASLAYYRSGRWQKPVAMEATDRTAEPPAQSTTDLPAV